VAAYIVAVVTTTATLTVSLVRFAYLSVRRAILLSAGFVYQTD
jgi:hypothetical protein